MSKKVIKYTRDDVERLLGYRIDELQTGTRAYLSSLISHYAHGYRLSNLQLKVGTSSTYLRRAEKHSKYFYTMVIGLENVLGHVEHGLTEYASIRDRIYKYDECGRSDDGKRSLYYKGLRCWNTVLLHELSHMLCHVHNCGDDHDDGFVAMYNKLIQECSDVETSVLGTLNAHDLVRSESYNGEGIGPYRTRIFNKTKEWNEIRRQNLGKSDDDGAYQSDAESGQSVQEQLQRTEDYNEYLKQVFPEPNSTYLSVEGLANEQPN